MSIKNAIIAEIEAETHNTKRLLNSLTDEHLDFRPHEKSMTMRELASHIVELHNWVHQAITKESFDFHTDYQPTQTPTVAALQSSLEDGLTKNKDFVNAQSDDFWSSQWTLKAGDHILSEMPKSSAFRFILINHLIHHRGQLTVYMRLLNIPLPGIYGPSADEK